MGGLLHPYEANKVAAEKIPVRVWPLHMERTGPGVASFNALLTPLSGPRTWRPRLTAKIAPLVSRPGGSENPCTVKASRLAQQSDIWDGRVRGALTTGQDARRNRSIALTMRTHLCY